VTRRLGGQLLLAPLQYQRFEDRRLGQLILAPPAVSEKGGPQVSSHINIPSLPAVLRRLGQLLLAPLRYQ